MARRRASESEFSARDTGDDFRARDTGDELDPLYVETPTNSADPVDDAVAAASEQIQGQRAPAAPRGRMSERLASLPPQTRAAFTYLARLARSLTEGPPHEARPIPPEQRSKGVVLVVQQLPDGRKVIFR